MEFPLYVSSEISAAMAEVLARHSGTTLQQLTAARDALDAAARMLETRSQPEHEIRDLAARLTAAADVEIRRIRGEAETAIDAARDGVRAQMAELEKLGAALARTEAERALLRSELETAQARADAAERDRALAAEAHGAVEAHLQKLQAESSGATAARAAAERDLSQAHATIEQLLAEVEELRGTIERQRTETATLHARLSEASEAGRQRDALSAQIQDAGERIEMLERQLADARAVSAQRDQLVGQVDEARRRIEALERDLAAAYQAHQDSEHLAVQLETAAREIHGLQSHLDDARRERDHREQLAQQLDIAGRRVHELESQLANAGRMQDDRDRLAAQIDDANRRIQHLESELVQARRACDEQADAIARSDADSGRLQQLEAASTSQQDHIRQLTARLEDALQSEARLQEKLAARVSDGAGADDTAAEIMRAEVDRMVALLDASARAVTEMAAAPNASDLLMELLKRLSLQFSRVALFRVKGNRLEGEQQVGFEDAVAVTKLTFPLSAPSILARAVNSRAIESVTGDDALARTGLPFGGTPTAAVAVPIVLQGEAVAVVYGDDVDMPDWARGPAVHESSVGFARLLVGQVSVLLMRHTQEMKTLAELRQYASTLLQEAKKMYLADSQAGRPADVLRSRLKDNLECASELYAYRAAMEGTAAAALLDEQIVAELEESTPFARDLAAVVAETAAGDLQITAEAS
jgi:predicted  nucleic acid-binding Zn-ribbon protein